MALFARPHQRWPCGAASVTPVTAVRREPGAAVARQGLRAAGPAAVSVPGSAMCPASYEQLARRARDSALVRGAFAYAAASPRGALCAPLKPVKEVVTTGLMAAA